MDFPRPVFLASEIKTNIPMKKALDIKLQHTNEEVENTNSKNLENKGLYTDRQKNEDITELGGERERKDKVV